MEYPKEKINTHQIEAVKKFNNDPNIKFEKISCLNCLSNESKILFINDRYGFNLTTVLCKSCGLIFSNPRMSEDTVNYFYKSDIYRTIYNGKKEDIYANAESKFSTVFSLKKKNKINLNNYYKQIFFDIINSLNLQYDNVCEIGAGCGWNLKPFQQMGKKVCGYEPSNLLSNFAKEKNINIINGTSNDVKGEYDLIILRHVFEHFLKPIEELKNLRKNIKKYIFIEVPGCVNALPSIQNAHNINFSLNTLNQTVTKCGFKKIYLDYCRSNEFIFGIFEKMDKVDEFNYSYKFEVKRVLKIYKKFRITSFIRRIIKKIHPKIDDILLKFYKYMKSLK